MDVPASGTYALELTAAAPNFDQVMDLTAGTNPVVQIRIPNTNGLWAKAPAVEIKLEKGIQKLRFSTPAERRAVALQKLEIKAKG